MYRQCHRELRRLTIEGAIRRLLDLGTALKPADGRAGLQWSVTMNADEERLKGIEALYHLTKAAYDAEISRYDATEAKAGRYLTVLGLIIGAFVFKFDELLSVWDNAAVPLWVAILFVVAYGVTVFAAVLAFVSSVVAMGVTEVSAIPVGEEIETLFQKHDYKVALEMTTESFRGEARKLRDTTAERIGHVERTNKLLKFIMVAGTVSLLVYFPIRLTARNAVQKHEESKMSDTAKPATTNTTQSQTKPADTAKPPAFDIVKRDIGDTVVRKK